MSWLRATFLANGASFHSSCRFVWRTISSVKVRSQAERMLPAGEGRRSQLRPRIWQRASAEQVRFRPFRQLPPPSISYGTGHLLLGLENADAITKSCDYKM